MTNLQDLIAVTPAPAEGQPVNHLTVSTTDTNEVRLQIFIAGTAGSWLNFNAAQLDVVIAHLQEHRRTIY